MLPYVANSLGGAFEMRFAIFTGVRLFPAVLHPDVNIQDVLIELLLSAFWTFKRLNASVSQQVHIEVSGVLEFLAAVVTNKDFSAFVPLSLPLYSIWNGVLLVFGIFGQDYGTVFRFP